MSFQLDCWQIEKCVFTVPPSPSHVLLPIFLKVGRRHWQKVFTPWFEELRFAPQVAQNWGRAFSAMCPGHMATTCGLSVTHWGRVSEWLCTLLPHHKNEKKKDLLDKIGHTPGSMLDKTVKREKIRDGKEGGKVGGKIRERGRGKGWRNW